MLASLLIVTALIISKANTPGPDIPLYPGSNYINLPKAHNEPNADFRVVMEASTDEMTAYEQYSKLLNQDGWGNGMQCYSGIPGTWIWRQRGLLDSQGWAVHIEYRGVNNHTTDIVVDVWKGFDTKITCGDM
jgi:hypothetical protein